MDPVDSTPSQEQWTQPQEQGSSLFFKYRFYFFAGAIGCVLLLMVTSLFLMNLSSSQPNANNPTPTPIQNDSHSRSQGLTRFSKTVIGETTEEELQEQVSVIKKESLQEGGTKYTIKSVNPVYPDEVLVKDDIVIFEITSTQTLSSGGYPLLSNFIEKYGEPEQIIKGNARLDQVTLSSYLYPSKGFVLLVNPKVNKVYEVQRFTPMSLESYMKQYESYVKGIEYQRL